MDKIEVMLVEDHVLVREGTRELLNREQDIQVAAEAGDGEEAVCLAHARHLDVILMDVAMPKMDGLEATRRIKAINPGAAILVLTAYDDDPTILAILEAGAAGYMLKDASTDDLVKGIRAIHAGESVLDTAVTRRVIDHFARGRKERHADQQKEGIPGRLTGRELEILQLAAKGMTNREIAGELGIRSRTVQVHMSSILSRLKVCSRLQAILRAVQERWVSL